MTKNYLTLILMLFSVLVFAQVRISKTEQWPEVNKKAKFYTVGGSRDGMSYFKNEQFPEVEYVAGEVLDFKKYHTQDVMYQWYKKWAAKYPDLVEIYEVGKSFEGRPIMQMTLTNKKTGKDTDKPAAFFEGGRHSGEVSGAESTLFLTQYLLENYGKDPKVTALIDTKTIYLKPVNNPDGHNMYLHSAQRNRSTVRPDDNDGDGLLDEDPEEDMDGDGVLHQMRRKAKPEELATADYIIDPKDKTGMLMKRVPAGQGKYFVYSEGIDSDNDGKYNEDGIGGLDLHRNYPTNWHPDEEATGRGFLQSGAGEYPLSEPETRAVVLFLMAHTNVSVANSMDTSVPMHLRGPSTSKSEESMTPADLKIFKHMDSLGVAITGYPWAGDVYEVYATRGGENANGDPAKPSPLFGHGPDFGYFGFGAVWYGDEIWNGGRHADLDKDGKIDGYDGFLWDQKENGGKGFMPWKKFMHPYLGEVEIGGPHPKFFSQNSPPAFLATWAGNEAMFNLAMAFELPQLKLDDVVVTPAENGLYNVKVSWTNTGKLPTAIDQAQKVKIVQEDRVQLDITDKSKLRGGASAPIAITMPKTTDKTVYAGFSQAGEKKEATFQVDMKKEKSIEATIKLLSTRGGYFEKKITIVAN